MINSPTIDKEEVEKFSRIADEWWDEKGKFRPLHIINPVRLQYIRDKICKHFGRDNTQIRSLSGLSLLDIGCGGGLMAEPLARLGTQVTAIDASEKNIKVAKLHSEKTGVEIDYQCSSAEDLFATTGKKFDVVLALEIVEHVADVKSFISACADLLKPNGLLFVSTINRTIKSYGLAIIGAEYLMRWLPIGTHDWQKFLRPSELCLQIRNNGLTIDEMTGMSFNPIKNSWHLNEKDLSVNYIISATKQLNIASQ